MQSEIRNSVVRVIALLGGAAWGVYAALLLAYGTRYLWATFMASQVMGDRKLIYISLAYSSLYKMQYQWGLPFALLSMALAIFVIVKNRMRL